MAAAWGKGMARKIGRLLFFLVLLLTGTAVPAFSSHEAPPRQVLVIHSYHLGFKWTDEMTQGITAALQEEGTTVRIRYEYMDTKHVSDAAYFELLYALYRHKYRSEKFAVIIATDNDAFTFLKKYRDALFPATPVIFCGMNYFSPDQLEGRQLFTGVNETADIKATLDLALQLHPATRQIVVINDKTSIGRLVHQEVMKLLPAYQGRVEFLFLEDVEMADILWAVQKLGSKSLIFYGLFFQDGAGRFYDYDEGIALIVANSPVPVYGVWDFYLGYGLIGGMLTSGYNQGETAGRMALRVLRGEKIENIPVVMKSPNHYMFDYRQLYRFGIDPAVLPAGSIIINQPSSLYAVPRPVFWGAVAALTTSALMIGLLLYNTAIRRRAERELQQAAERNLRLATIVDSSDDAIVGRTVDGIITSWNKGAEKIFGYSEGEVLGTSIAMLIPPEYRKEAFSLHEKIKGGEHIEHFETVRTGKNGERIFMSLSYSPVKDEQGRVVAVSAIGRDITEQKRAERLLLDHVRFERELEIAQEIQQSFLADCPQQLPGLLMACCCLPAAHVGGDYYDFFTPEADLVDLVIADITGHNLGAALLMTETRSVLHAKVGAGRSPGKLLAEVNDLLYDDLNRAELQISMFYVRLETETRTLLYANAGHTHPLLYHSRNGTLEELDGDGFLLGIEAELFFEEKSRNLENGDILLLYTDGVTEAENAQEEVFGVERLGKIVAEQAQRHPQAIIDAILAGLATFSGAKPCNDDVTMVAMKVI
jgi:PAS domain S-box-containing protein